MGEDGREGVELRVWRMEGVAGVDSFWFELELE